MTPKGGYVPFVRRNKRTKSKPAPRQLIQLAMLFISHPSCLGCSNNHYSLADLVKSPCRAHCNLLARFNGFYITARISQIVCFQVMALNFSLFLCVICEAICVLVLWYTSIIINYCDWKSLKQFERYCVSRFLRPTFLNTSDSADKGPEEHLESGLESAPQSSTARKYQIKHKLFIRGLLNKLKIHKVPEFLTVTEEQVTMYMARNQTQTNHKENASGFYEQFLV